MEVVDGVVFEVVDWVVPVEVKMEVVDGMVFEVVD
jgi:hypothetical protein